MLLNIKDVPTENFDRRENRSFLTGAGGKNNDDVVKRAREMSSLTVWRMMRSSRSSRSLWVELIPFATRADAEISLTRILGDLRGAPLAPRMNNRTVTLENLFLEGVSNYVAMEQSSINEKKGIQELILAGVIDRYEFGMGFGSEDEYWTWDEAVPVIQLQIQKVRQGIR
jgi:hypothetical protein